MNLSNKFIQHGLILFLLGLLTGFFIPLMNSPRLGLSGHLEAVLNGMFLILVGLIWNKVRLSPMTMKKTYYTLLFGTYTNWMTVTMAGIWGAGGEMMPLAGGKLKGSLIQEVLIKTGLISLSLAMVYATIILILGLRKNTEASH